jgi:PAS domain S-box-containing protein
MRLFSEDGLRLEPVAGYHADSEVLADAWESMQQTVESIGAGVWVPAMNGHRPTRLQFDQLQAESEAAPSQLAFIRKYQVSSIILAPLVARGRVLGGIALVRLGGGPAHTRAEMRLIGDLASRAALALDNARLLRDVRHAEELLRSANQELSARVTHLAALALDNARLYQEVDAELAERKRVEIVLRIRGEQQTALLQLHRAVLEGADMAMVLEAAVTSAARWLDVERAALFLTDEPDQLRVAATVGWSDEPEDPLDIVGEHVRRSIEQKGTVALPPTWQAHGLASGVAVVLAGTAWPAVIGALAVHSARPREFTDEDLAFLEALSAVVGGAIARKQFESEIYDREVAIRALVENTPDVISRWDRDLRRVYVNPAIERATGQPASAFIGRTNRELGMATPLVDRWEMVANQVFRSGREQTIEVSWETPTGGREYETRLTPELAADGTVASILSVARDITDQRRADLDRRALVQEVLQREARLQELVSHLVVDQARDTRLAIGSVELGRLTPREREILRLVVAGQTNGQIARKLGLAAGTVKNHVARLLPKLGAADRTQAAVRAVEYGLLETD